MSLLDYLYHFIGIALFVGYAVMIVGLLFRVVQLFVQRDVMTGLVWATKIVTDPFSGISFLLSIYPGYHMVIVEVSLAWGVKAVKSEAITTLLG